MKAQKQLQKNAINLKLNFWHIEAYTHTHKRTLAQGEKVKYIGALGEILKSQNEALNVLKKAGY